MSNRKEILKCFQTKSKFNVFKKSSLDNILFSVPAECCICHIVFKLKNIISQLIYNEKTFRVYKSLSAYSSLILLYLFILLH